MIETDIKESPLKRMRILSPKSEKKEIDSLPPLDKFHSMAYDRSNFILEAMSNRQNEK